MDLLGGSAQVSGHRPFAKCCMWRWDAHLSFLDEDPPEPAPNSAVDGKHPAGPPSIL